MHKRCIYLYILIEITLLCSCRVISDRSHKQSTIHIVHLKVRSQYPECRWNVDVFGVFCLLLVRCSPPQAELVCIIPTPIADLWPKRKETTKWTLKYSVLNFAFWNTPNAEKWKTTMWLLSYFCIGRFIVTWKIWKCQDVLIVTDTYSWELLCTLVIPVMV